MNATSSTLYCSFCCKSQHEVLKLIIGANVGICDECVDLCVDIIREEKLKEARLQGGDREYVSWFAK